MKSPPVRFGLIGAGAIAQTYAQVFTDWSGGCLAGIADIRAEAARSLGGAMKCPAYIDHLDLLNSDVEAVIICTPPNTHEELVVESAHRGKHVLCEKPFALDSASARRMIQAAEKAEVRLTMASKFRYTDDVVRAKSIVTSGILGELLSIENSFTAKVDMSNRWNSDPGVSGGGVLIDNGTHSVDIMRYLLGPIVEVMAVEGKRVQNLPVEDNAYLLVRSACGVIGRIDLSWSINKDNDWYLCIFGSTGTVQVGWRESRYRQASSREWIVFGKGYHKVQAFRDELANFAAAIRGEDRLLITAEDALASVEVIEAAYRSMPKAHWTPVEAPHWAEAPL
ncbi:MAG: Gfo/Idh/MocA family oxidoreductase [Gemmataceae bacterium]|nr:Gfo/Idh/MocA family oxidoreductase [Gemmataceae bacterium]